MIMEKPETLDPRIKKIAEYSLEKLNLHEVHLKKTKEILPYAKDLFELLYEAYKNIYGVIPLDDKQVELYIGQFITLVKPEFLTLIVDENNIPVSFGVVIPSPCGYGARLQRTPLPLRLGPFAALSHRKKA